MLLPEFTTRTRALPLDFLKLWRSPKNEIPTFSDVLYVFETEHGRRFNAGSAKHVVDIDLAIAPRIRHDGGAGRTATPSEVSEAGGHAPQDITMKCNCCGEALS